MPQSFNDYNTLNHIREFLGSADVVSPTEADEIMEVLARRPQFCTLTKEGRRAVVRELSRLAVIFSDRHMEALGELQMFQMLFKFRNPNAIEGEECLDPTFQRLEKDAMDKEMIADFLSVLARASREFLPMWEGLLEQRKRAEARKLAQTSASDA